MVNDYLKAKRRFSITIHSKFESHRYFLYAEREAANENSKLSSVTALISKNASMNTNLGACFLFGTNQSAA